MIRLDKYLADAGIGTRSEIKAYCKKGLVSIDHVVCREADQKIDPDRMAVTFRGMTIESPTQKRVCYMLNKPEGYLCATADKDTQTVFALLPDVSPQHFFPIGRLDKDSEGLLLITNDGALSHRLTSPRRHVPKTYEVWITGILSESEVNALKNGTDIGDDSLTLPADVEVLQTEQDYRLSDAQRSRLPSSVPERIPASRIRITITEGRYHQVKRMFHANRHEVFFLKRTAIGRLTLDASLKTGAYRMLSESEITDAGMSKEDIVPCL